MGAFLVLMLMNPSHCQYPTECFRGEQQNGAFADLRIDQIHVYHYYVYILAP